jgi:hypothetical protein
MLSSFHHFFPSVKYFSSNSLSFQTSLLVLRDGLGHQLLFRKMFFFLFLKAINMFVYTLLLILFSFVLRDCSKQTELRTYYSSKM